MFGLNNFNSYSNDYNNSNSRPESSHAASEKVQKPYYCDEYSSLKSKDISNEKVLSDINWGQEPKTAASTSQKPNYQSEPQNQVIRSCSLFTFKIILFQYYISSCR